MKSNGFQRELVENMNRGRGADINDEPIEKEHLEAMKKQRPKECLHFYEIEKGLDRTMHYKDGSISRKTFYTFDGTREIAVFERRGSRFKHQGIFVERWGPGYEGGRSPGEIVRLRDEKGEVIARVRIGRKWPQGWKVRHDPMAQSYDCSLRLNGKGYGGFGTPLEEKESVVCEWMLQHMRDILCGVLPIKDGEPDHVILFTPVEREQHDKLRALSFKSHRSIAALTRDALKNFIREKE